MFIPYMSYLNLLFVFKSTLNDALSSHLNLEVINSVDGDHTIAQFRSLLDDGLSPDLFFIVRSRNYNCYTITIVDKSSLKQIKSKFVVLIFMFGLREVTLVDVVSGKEMKNEKVLPILKCFEIACLIVQKMMFIHKDLMAKLDAKSIKVLDYAVIAEEIDGAMSYERATGNLLARVTDQALVWMTEVEKCNLNIPLAILGTEIFGNAANFNEAIDHKYKEYMRPSEIKEIK